MPHSTHGTVVLMGSGEMAPSMVEVHKYAMSLVEGPVRAVFADTPAGFQLNAALLGERAQTYFQDRLGTELGKSQICNIRSTSHVSPLKLTGRHADQLRVRQSISDVARGTNDLIPREGVVELEHHALALGMDVS